MAPQLRKGVEARLFGDVRGQRSAVLIVRDAVAVGVDRSVALAAGRLRRFPALAADPARRIARIFHRRRAALGLGVDRRLTLNRDVAADRNAEAADGRAPMVRIMDAVALSDGPRGVVAAGHVEPGRVARTDLVPSQWDRQREEGGEDRRARGHCRDAAPLHPSADARRAASRPSPEAPRAHLYEALVMVISTRRFFARPSGLSEPSGLALGATGLAAPHPGVVIR